MDAAALNTRLSAIMRAELTYLSKLRGLLDTESTAIHEMNTSLLLEMTAQKQALMDQLQNMADQRRRLLAETEIPPDRNAMNELLELCKPDNQLQQQADEIASLLSSCEALNKANGIRINRNQFHLQKALAVLHGDTDSPGIYGAAGKTSTGRQARMLGSA